MFLLSGITGKVGGAAARDLLEKGHSVRALVRDPAASANWTERGVEIRQGDFNDVESLAAALMGVDGAFVMLPPILDPAPDFSEARSMIANFREALTSVPPRRLVILSSFGSQQTSGLGLITSTHLLEAGLDDMSLPIAAVRAGSFLENFAYGLERVAATGRFDTFMAPTDRPVPMVGSADIGKEVARLLAHGWMGDRKIVELGTRFTPDDIARAMSEVLGQPIEARPIPREAWPATLEAIGMVPGTTGAYEEMLDGINSGWIDFGEPAAESVAISTLPAQVFAQARGA